MLIVPAILATITYYLYQCEECNSLGFNLWYLPAGLLVFKLIYLCLIWHRIAFSAVLLKNVAAFLGMGA